MREVQTSETVTVDSDSLRAAFSSPELIVPGTGFADSNPPRTNKAEKRDDVISVSDEATLNWYHSRGVSIYERSTFGAIIEHLKYGAMGSHPCLRCDGAGILDDGGFRLDDTCRRCKGEGYESETLCPLCRGTRKEASYEVKLEKGGWCNSCRGTGASGIDRRGSKPTACHACPGRHKTKQCKNCGTCKRCVAARACRNCRNCLGTGNEPLSVHPLGLDGATGREGADDAALTKFALTSRRLGRMHSRYRRALGKYYGEEGTSWGLTERGRIFALYGETPAGKEIIRNAKRLARREWKNPKPAFEGVGFTNEKKHATARKRFLNRMKKRGELLDARPEGLAEFIGPMPRPRGFLTQAALSEHDIVQPKKFLTALEIIADEGDEERRHSNPIRRKLFVEAGKQARELYAKSATAWHEAAGGLPQRVATALIERANKLGLGHLANEFARAAVNQ